ncbi:MAG: rod shape-determining protein RodA [Thermodesulfobacteriota bacterium]
MLQFDRRLLENFDWVLVFAVLLVSGCGLANLYSATYHGLGGGFAVFLKQLFYFGVGFVCAFLLLTFDYRSLHTASYWIYGGAVLLLVIALIGGRSIANTQRWIDLGFFNLQPSEPAKLAIIVFLASYYARKDTGDGFGFTDILYPGFLTLIPVALIIKQPDLGTAMMFVFVFISITLFMGLRWSAVGILAALGGGVAFIGYKFLLKPYQLQRIKTFLDPESDPLKTGYHIMQSKIAVGSGLKFGKGWLHGTQVHLDFLPERHTDFAFSVWGEEFGFLGCLIFLACYFFFILWCLNVAVSARDKFGVVLGFGIVTLIFWQAVINMGMVIGLLPVVGMPLPLFSYGGSSLLTTMVGVGLLMNIRIRRFMKPPRKQQ